MNPTLHKEASRLKPSIKNVKKWISLFFFLVLTHLSPAQETAYKPEHPVDESNLTVQIGSTRLLSQQSVFEQNIEVKALAAFIKSLQANITKTIGKPSSEYDLQLEVKLSKEAAPSIDLASQGEVSDAVLQTIYDGLKTIPDIRSSKDDLSFQVIFKIRKQP